MRKAVLLISGDLLGASRVEAAAQQAGVGYRMLASVEAAADFCRVERVVLVMVDLATPGMDIAALVTRLTKNVEHPPAIVAYGPHVHEAVLDAAKAAGCDQVLSRGQFMGQVGTIIAHYTAQ